MSLVDGDGESAIQAVDVLRRLYVPHKRLVRLTIPRDLRLATSASKAVHHHSLWTPASPLLRFCYWVAVVSVVVRPDVLAVRNAKPPISFRYPLFSFLFRKPFHANLFA
jgi:hypothetical protein